MITRIVAILSSMRIPSFRYAFGDSMPCVRQKYTAMDIKIFYRIVSEVYAYSTVSEEERG